MYKVTLLIINYKQQPYPFLYLIFMIKMGVWEAMSYECGRICIFKNLESFLNMYDLPNSTTFWLVPEGKGNYVHFAKDPQMISILPTLNPLENQ